MTEPTIQTCDCGNDTYHFKWELVEDGTEEWIECAECGRPSSVVGVGMEKQLEWMAAQDRG